MNLLLSYTCPLLDQLIITLFSPCRAVSQLVTLISAGIWIVTLYIGILADMLISTMRLATALACVLAFSVTSHGWVMDKSCFPYESTVLEGMKGAFRLAGAGSYSLNQLSQPNPGPTSVAQKDLLSYLFAEAMTYGNINTDNEKWKNAKEKFSYVLDYMTTSDGGPETFDGKYWFLSVHDVVLYCDHSRFEEDKDCRGNAKRGYTCDTSIAADFRMNSIYSDCKRTNIFSPSTVQVDMAPTYAAEIKTYFDIGVDTTLGFSWTSTSLSNSIVP